MTVDCVVNFSGGAGSYVAAKRAIARYGDRCTLLFCDTGTEDPDLYRFLDDCDKLFPQKIVRVADGRTIWQVFRDARFLGNNRVPVCSRVLKHAVAERWVDANCPDAVQVFGIDWSEAHRAERIAKRLAPVHVWFPLLDHPPATKADCLAEIEADGITIPRLYTLGAPHNNCGGACVRAGHAHFRWLYHALPCVYAEWEAHERELREYLGADVSILKDRSCGESRPLTLEEFRRSIEAHAPTLWEEEWGGCGCFVEV